MSKKIVCRCEDVVLEDLRRAFDAGFRDLESLKRFTGLATGFCQGKGCLAHAARFLSALRGGDDMINAPIRSRPPWQPTPLCCLAGEETEEAK